MRRLRRRGRFIEVTFTMNHNEDDVTCSICGVEHDKERSPELDSTHLCPDCAAMQRRAAMSPRSSFLLSGEQNAVHRAE
jgi:hypothetical protein